MAMSRVFGDLTCNMCGKLPDLGWLYQCHQDSQPDCPLPNINSAPVVPDESDYFDAKARVAEHLHMSSSVVKGIRAGEYDIEQGTFLVP